MEEIISSWKTADELVTELVTHHADSPLKDLRTKRTKIEKIQEKKALRGIGHPRPDSSQTRARVIESRAPLEDLAKDTRTKMHFRVMDANGEEVAFPLQLISDTTYTKS